jgi:SAM-dependent methyltransferase
MNVQLPDVIRKLHSTEQFMDSYGKQSALVLNIGSAGTRPARHCINLDIQPKAGIDIVADAHELPFQAPTFDVIILSAVLQYCRDPYRVASEAYRVLKPNGYIYVDAPFVQPYCPDTPDLFRFSREGLEVVFGTKFAIVETGASIPGGSALAFYCQCLVGNSQNRYINFLVKMFVSLLLLPLSALKYNVSTNVAGAIYLIGKKGKV